MGLRDAECTKFVLKDSLFRKLSINPEHVLLELANVVWSFSQKLVDSWIHTLAADSIEGTLKIWRRRNEKLLSTLLLASEFSNEIKNLAGKLPGNSCRW